MNWIKDFLEGGKTIASIVCNIVNHTMCSHEWEEWRNFPQVSHQTNFVNAHEQRNCKKCNKWEVR